jgi:hypothetical protein
METAIEAGIGKLTIGGDLLELCHVSIDDPGAKGSWVFAAPPAFVLRPASKLAFLIGITVDGIAPLPQALRQRIKYEGYSRLIDQQADENLADVLHELGLVQLSEQSWLKLPRKETAGELVHRVESQLMAQPPSGEVTELLILDSARDPIYYRGRWVAPKSQSGCFVARRPQAYRAPLWGYALLQQGALSKFLDFPLKGSKWRGCDFAWYLQAAIDHHGDAPQQYRTRTVHGGTIVDFFSPLPMWAERRLALIGHSVEPNQSLFSYYLSERDVKTELEFFQDRLWLSRTNDSQ